MLNETVSKHSWTRVWFTPPNEYYSKNELGDCLHWCRETFGFEDSYDTWTGNGWAYIGRGQFKFAKEQDAVLFTLRWS